MKNQKAQIIGRLGKRVLNIFLFKNSVIVGKYDAGSTPTGLWKPSSEARLLVPSPLNGVFRSLPV